MLSTEARIFVDSVIELDMADLYAPKSFWDSIRIKLESRIEAFERVRIDQTKQALIDAIKREDV